MTDKNEKYRKIFSNNLNYYMQINGKKQDDLVKDLGINSSTISSWCTAQKLPRMDKIVMLANYFNINFAKLIEERTDNNYFEFVAEDDAMFPLLDVGDIALIYKQSYIKNDATYLIIFDGKKTIRKIILNENKTSYILHAMNNYCKDILIPVNEISKIEILGKVVKIENTSAFK